MVNTVVADSTKLHEPAVLPAAAPKRGIHTQIKKNSQVTAPLRKAACMVKADHRLHILVTVDIMPVKISSMASATIWTQGRTGPCP